jgi:hypothetical protein
MRAVALALVSGAVVHAGRVALEDQHAVAEVGVQALATAGVEAAVAHGDDLALALQVEARRRFGGIGAADDASGDVVADATPRPRRDLRDTMHRGELAQTRGQAGVAGRHQVQPPRPRAARRDTKAQCARALGHAFEIGAVEDLEHERQLGPRRALAPGSQRSRRQARRHPVVVRQGADPAHRRQGPDARQHGGIGAHDVAKAAGRAPHQRTRLAQRAHPGRLDRADELHHVVMRLAVTPPARRRRRLRGRVHVGVAQSQAVLLAQVFARPAARQLARGCRVDRDNDEGVVACHRLTERLDRRVLGGRRKHLQRLHPAAFGQPERAD